MGTLVPNVAETQSDLSENSHSEKTQNLYFISFPSLFSIFFVRRVGKGGNTGWFLQLSELTQFGTFMGGNQRQRIRKRELRPLESHESGKVQWQKRTAFT